MNYRRCHWVVAVAFEVVERSPYIHVGKFHFVSSTSSLLRFVVVDLV